MKIVKNIKVPTGNICIGEGERGLLEFLSLGDYGKSKNVKADFLGLEKDINGVPHGELLPLEEKWVITISSQYGCSMMCKFCDVPKVRAGINATWKDMLDQVELGLRLHPEVKATKRLNVHVARMGEPTFNKDVLLFTRLLRNTVVRPCIGNSLIHPVVSTMMPKRNINLMRFLNTWTIDIKNGLYRGDAGLQLSINSTNELQRKDMFSNNALTLDEISIIGNSLIEPRGRKYALNFALADDYEVDAIKLRTLFHPDKFMVKITPLHKTLSCTENKISTTGGYENYTPYQEVEKNLKEVGFDVLVFVPSYEEDLGRITCGNAILSGTMPECEYEEL
jgi:23S rRNA (adenine2503-C2)-methyltransferase